MLELEDLQKDNSYLIDLGSTLDLFGPATDDFLCGKSKWNEILSSWRWRDKPSRREAAWQTVAMEATREIQQAIELMVTADAIAFDAVLEGESSRRLRFQLSESWAYEKKLLAPVKVPGSVREAASEGIDQFGKDLVSRFGDGYPGLFHAWDKRCHDHGRLVEHGRAAWFANSSDHPLRALYYLLLAEFSHVHCFLSVTKRGYLDHLAGIGREIGEIMDPHTEVKDAVLSRLNTQKDLLPPVAEIVLVHALEEQLAPGDALLAVRQGSEAVAYRQKLRELRHCAQIPTVACQAEVQGYLDELSELAKVWTHDPYKAVGEVSTPVTATVAGIPYVGPLMAQLVPKLAARIPEHWPGSPDQAKLFISRWFHNTYAQP